ncbi:MAG: DUF2652 domain-containing protein [Ignavibacteria bacterium]|nr:DUF2652 domain-containing protein [Ignavibacteria bacterium]
MSSGITRGYLVLADISGFTSFVAETELLHAKSILSDIFRLIVGSFGTSLKVAEIEGDAVFAFVPKEDLRRGELLLEIIESTYVKFRNRQLSSDRMAKCECRACEQSSSLDLKFIAHYGDFALQKVTGRLKPLGTSVNTVHRLSKNGITSSTGWRGYALFTKECLNELGVRPDQLHEATEEYEHLGKIRTFSFNLEDRLNAYMEARKVVVEEARAHVEIVKEYPVTPAVLWDWLNDPVRRLQWMITSDWQALTRPGGRLGQGAANHCIKSGFVETILDWHPFSYFTVRLGRGPISFIATSELVPADSGTRLIWRARSDSRLPDWMMRPVCRLLISRGARSQENLKLLGELLEKEQNEPVKSPNQGSGD